jgi:hypothetical protein
MEEHGHSYEPLAIWANWFCEQLRKTIISLLSEQLMAGCLRVFANRESKALKIED